MAKKKTMKISRALTTVRIAGPTAVSVLKSARIAAKLPGVQAEVVRQEGTTLVTGVSYATSERTLPDAEVFFVEGCKPRGQGPWLHEADKVAWRDEATGYDCIMLRATNGGYLSGYVGVPQDHPLWSWEREAIAPDMGVDVHGGLTYSAICQDGPSPQRRIVVEARRICHVPSTPPRYVPLRHGSDYRVEDAHAWWFGFDCITSTTSFRANRVSSAGSSGLRPVRNTATMPTSCARSSISPYSYAR